MRHEEGVCVTTNTVEGYFSILKRGVNGVYHHVSKKHCTGILASSITATTIARLPTSSASSFRCRASLESA